MMLFAYIVAIAEMFSREWERERLYIELVKVKAKTFNDLDINGLVCPKKTLKRKRRCILSSDRGRPGNRGNLRTRETSV
jgi:hypothetical protein